MGAGKKRQRRLTLSGGWPQEVITGGARVTLHDQACVMIEGQRGMVELGHTRMRMKTRHGVLAVLGTGLEIRELTQDAAMIAGERIDTITYGLDRREEP